jgi:K+-sensing histidine kinase KdpD
VRTNLPADLPLVSVDDILLEQVFINLLGERRQVHATGQPDRGVCHGTRR